MAGDGLSWLAGPRYAGDYGFCLTFVRGLDTGEVFTAFGADPEDARPRNRYEPGRGPFVRVGRSGPWLVALEEHGWPPQGTRPEVLRRVSAGGEAVAVYQDVGYLRHVFGYAAGADVVTRLVTTAPPTWQGSDPGRFRAAAAELGGGRPGAPALRVLLALAEGCGASLSEDDLAADWPSAPVLPILDDLADTPESEPPTAPVVDAMLTHAGRDIVAAALAVRMRRLMSETGLEDVRNLVDPMWGALTGSFWTVTDDDPVGHALRRLVWESREAEEREVPSVLSMLDEPAAVRAELRRQARRGYAARMLRLILAGRFRRALREGIISERDRGVPRWRQDALVDLTGTHVPPGELRAARELQSDIEAFGADLRRWREGIDLPRDTLAELTGATSAYISHVENGNLMPDEAFAAAADGQMRAGGTLLHRWTLLQAEAEYRYGRLSE